MFRCFLLLVFFITCLPCFSLVQAKTKDKSTIAAPYFYVEDESIPLEHFPLKDTRVEAVISGVIANVTVTQVYGNTGDRPINARYVFPGSTHAAIHGMTMTIGERRIRAQIKEKNEAKKIFDTAKNEGKNASLLKQHRPNVFSMDVANIMPGDEIAIELNYSEILSPQDATYTFVYPAVVGPRYNDKVDLLDEETSWLMNPYLPVGKAARTDFSLDLKLESGIPIHDIRCASHDPKVVFQSEKNVAIHIDSRKEFAGNRDFILNYRLQGKQIESGLLVYQGEKENYFLLMAQPPEKHDSDAIPPREYLFVIDVSGSMSGFPLDTAKILLTSLLSELRPTDMFNLVLFAGSSELLSNYSLPANNKEIQRAIHLINTHKGGGGTNLLNALQKVTALPKQEGFSRSTIVITDGYIFAEREIFETIEQDLDNNNFFVQVSIVI
ncbi:MAG: hypothetical protein CSA26_12850 [Desulfobacterales bacterium]|nr:MAG: hypothetical protein CSA26_12850 [Desulfobacterales bacterium]